MKKTSFIASAIVSMMLLSGCNTGFKGSVSSSATPSTPNNPTSNPSNN